jgi:O-antigen ligase
LSTEIPAPSASASSVVVRAPAAPRAAAAARRPSRTDFRAGLALAFAYATGLALARLIDVSEDGKAMFAFGTSFTLVCAVVALVRPRWLLPLFVAYLPYSRAYPLPVGGITGANLTNLLLVLVFLTWLSGRFGAAPRKRLRVGAPELIAAAYVAVASLSAVTAKLGGAETFDVVLDYRAWLAPILLFFLVRATVRQRQEIAALVLVMAWTTALIGGITWWEGIDRSTRGSIEAARVKGLMMQANQMGAFLVYYGVPLLAYALTLRPWRRGLPYFAGYLVAMRAMLFTFSRGAYLAFVAGSAVVALLRNPLYLVAAAGGGVAAVAAFPGLIPDSVRERLDSTTQEGTQTGEAATLDRSSVLRLVIWKGAARMIAERPLQGVGLGQFPQLIGRYTELPLAKTDPHDAHNAFVLVAAEMGIPALLLLLLFLGALAATAVDTYFRRRLAPDRPLALACVGLVVSVCVSCMLGSRFSDESMIGYAWVLAGLTVVVARLPAPSGAATRSRWR